MYTVVVARHPEKKVDVNYAMLFLSLSIDFGTAPDNLGAERRTMSQPGVEFSYFLPFQQ